MTQVPVRIKVRCGGCRSGFRLSQEQYQELLKRSRVGLRCPHCGHDFEYNPIAAASERKVVEGKSDEKKPTPSFALPEALPVAAPEFPPPPFAPLGMGTPAAAGATPPPFAPLDGNAFAATPAAYPQGAPAPSGGEAKKLTLNERWKKLPPWVQWTVIGVLIVVMGVIIFAMPTGGGIAPEAEKPKAVERTAPSAEKKSSESKKGEADAPKTEHQKPKTDPKQP